VEAPEQRELLAWAYQAFRAVRPALAELPWQFIHGDAHDENLLVEEERVVGLIDFGDCCHNPTVSDLAICLTYLMMRGADPLSTASAILRGYGSVRPLLPAERAVLYPLICGRLAVSLCIASERKRIDPHNPNWFGGERRSWQFLHWLRASSFSFSIASSIIRE
jgi:Ser/Thr protein kinase RdoA (MazF antagonist)